MTKDGVGQAESPQWRREATLRDLLDMLDKIESSDRSLEQKAKLRQRVIDYGQHLSEEIHFGRRQVPESDDNETIKEFNLRMSSTYDTKGQSSYEEALRPAGYYDDKGRFVNPSYDYASSGKTGALNPRWHPIPLKENAEIIPPIDLKTKDDMHTGGFAGGTVPAGNTGASENIVPAQNAGATVTGGGNSLGKTPAQNEALKEKTDSKSDKKRRHIPLWPIALIGAAATLLSHNKDKAAPVLTNDDDVKNKDKTEVVVSTPQLTPAEHDYMKYTVEKGQRMMAKQFNVSVDEGAEIYNQFVENIKNGNMPDELMKLTESYQMSKMVREDLGLNLDRPEIVATTLMLMSESYDAIRPIIHKTIKDPTQEISAADGVRLKKCFSMAKHAADAHRVNPESNLVSTVDYGLYGADKDTGWSISFRENQKQSDKANYGKIVDNALQKGVEY